MIDTSFISTLKDYETETINGITVHYFDQIAEFEIGENTIRIKWYRDSCNSHYSVTNANPYCYFTIRTHVGPDRFTRDDMKRFARAMIDRSKMILDSIRFEAEQRKTHWNGAIID